MSAWEEIEACLKLNYGLFLLLFFNIGISGFFFFFFWSQRGLTNRSNVQNNIAKLG